MGGFIVGESEAQDSEMIGPRSCDEFYDNVRITVEG